MQSRKGREIVLLRNNEITVLKKTKVLCQRCFIRIKYDSYFLIILAKKQVLGNYIKLVALPEKFITEERCAPGRFPVA